MDIQKNLVNSLKIAARHADTLRIGTAERLGTTLDGLSQIEREKLIKQRLHADMLRDMRAVMTIYLVAGALVFAMAFIAIVGG